MEIFLKQGIATTIVFPLLTASSATRKTLATLAAGDFKIARHTAGVWNIGNPNTATPTELTGLGLYALPLTATELTPDDQQYPIVIACHDAAGAEWDDQAIIIRVFDNDIENLPAVTLANGAHGGVGASLTLATPLASQASVNAIATILTGITSLANWLRGLARKDAMNGVAKAELNAGGGAFDEATDSQEAIADAIVPGAPINIVVDETDIVVNP